MIRTYFACTTSITVSTPTSFKQTTNYKIGSMGIATFTYDNFITNNSYCPVISHKIVASLKTNSAPSYITISEGAT